MHCRTQEAVSAVLVWSHVEMLSSVLLTHGNSVITSGVTFMMTKPRSVQQAESCFNVVVLVAAKNEIMWFT